MVMEFLGRLLIDMLLHLAEDLCTRKEIAPFHPFNDISITGTIRPCDTRDTGSPGELSGGL
jgi:hypothetical protein